MLFRQPTSYYQTRDFNKLSMDIATDTKIKVSPFETKISLQSELILCKSCLWCASATSRRGSLNTCPVRGTVDVQMTPIHDFYYEDCAKTITEPLHLFEDRL